MLTHSTMTTSPRETSASFERTRAQWARSTDHGDLWVFGYASLIWRPEFRAVEQRPATVRGWHRALQMHSRLYRGPPELPGLVFALVSGGMCRGVVFRIARDRADDELQRLWRREMVSGIYDPRWLNCHTAHGSVPALAFTLSRRSASFTGKLDDAQVLHVLRHAKGRYGSSLDYLLNTARALHEQRVHDREIVRLVALAHAQGLA
jgi:cation transport protein ChaC